jgi:hypothetical protein
VGLDQESAAALLPPSTAPEVRDVLVASTAGNPLGLLELPASLSAAQLAGREPLPGRLPVGSEVFGDRVRRQPAATQTLLLVAAAEDSGDLGVVLRAAQVLGIGPDALDDAESAGLVRVDDGVVSFRHPLVRSAVYEGATSSRRRAVRQALASVLDGDADADRRSWHLAAAATGPDEAVAGDLERSAERAGRRAATRRRPAPGSARHSSPRGRSRGPGASLPRRSRPGWPVKRTAREACSTGPP